MTKRDTKRIAPEPTGAPTTPAENARESVDWRRRPGPGETAETMEQPQAPLDPEGQSTVQRMKDALFADATQDDAGSLPHQAETNVGPVKEGSVLPPRPEENPSSLPEKPPTL